MEIIHNNIDDIINDKRRAFQASLTGEATNEDEKIETYIRFGIDENSPRYSLSQEICLHRKKLMGEATEEEWTSYVNFVEKCIEKARETDGNS